MLCWLTSCLIQHLLPHETGHASAAVDTQPQSIQQAQEEVHPGVARAEVYLRGDRALVWGSESCKCQCFMDEKVNWTCNKRVWGLCKWCESIWICESGEWGFCKGCEIVWTCEVSEWGFCKGCEIVWECEERVWELCKGCKIVWGKNEWGICRGWGIIVCTWGKNEWGFCRGCEVIVCTRGKNDWRFCNECERELNMRKRMNEGLVNVNSGRLVKIILHNLHFLTIEYKHVNHYPFLSIISFNFCLILNLCVQTLFLSY